MVWSGCDQLCHPLGCQWLPSGSLGPCGRHSCDPCELDILFFFIHMHLRLIVVVKQWFGVARFWLSTSTVFASFDLRRDKHYSVSKRFTVLALLQYHIHLTTQTPISKSDFITLATRGLAWSVPTAGVCLHGCFRQKLHWSIAVGGSAVCVNMKWLRYCSSTSSTLSDIFVLRSYLTRPPWDKNLQKHNLCCKGFRS